MEYHNRINLSIEDMRKIHQHFIKSATDKLDLYLPDDNATDNLKSRVSSLVNEFIYSILEASRNSLEIDGLSSQEPLEKAMVNPSNETDVFDFMLQERVRKLYEDVENQTTSLTQLRKEKPFQLQDHFKKSYEQSLKDLDLLKQQIDSEFQNEDEQEKDVVDEKIESFNRTTAPKIDEMIKEYEDSLKKIQILRDSIPKERKDIEKLCHLTGLATENEDSDGHSV